MNNEPYRVSTDKLMSTVSYYYHTHLVVRYLPDLLDTQLARKGTKTVGTVSPVSEGFPGEVTRWHLHPSDPSQEHIQNVFLLSVQEELLISG
jgi:hypothetical protein